MRKKIFLISVVFLFIAVVSAALFILKSKSRTKISFPQTVGFFIYGPDIREMKNFKAYGINYYSGIRENIHCKQHFRLDTLYIYRNWRYDEIFRKNISEIFLKVDTATWNKVEHIWFKNDDLVFSYSRDLFEREWKYKKNNGEVIFKNSNNHIKHKTLYDGFDILLNSEIYGFISYRLILNATIILEIFLILLLISILLQPKIANFREKFREHFARNKNIYSKFLSFILGLICVILLLEIGLRVLGHYHKQKSVAYNYSWISGDKTQILCLGDSYTEGFGVVDSLSYPGILNKLVRDISGKEISVVNYGRSGKNTFQIRVEFENYLNSNTPGMVIIMAGSANYWNYYGFNRQSGFLYNFRVYKFIKLLWHELFGAGVTSKRNFDKEEVFIEENYNSNPVKDKVDDWVRDDINAIIELCRKKSIPILIMTYPLQNKDVVFGGVNAVLRD
ncbi:MAG: hypothetical protein WHW07_05545, partial [Bacteroidales bacterium]